MKENINIKDFLDFNFLSNVQYANDGKHCAFVKSVCDEEENTYHSYLYIYDGKQCRQLTSYGKESMYLWEDEEHILFAGMRDEKDKEAISNGEEKTCFYRICIHGGEAQKAFSIPLSLTSIKQIEKDQFVFSANYDLMYSYMYALDEDKKGRLLKEKKEMQDYEILDEVPFYGNGEGFTNKKRNSLFLYDVKNHEITRISEELFALQDYELSEDHKGVYYVGEEYAACPSLKEGIYYYDFQQQKSEVFIKPEVYSISKILPYMGTLLVIASDQKNYGINENSKFYVWNATTKTLDLWKEYEDSFGSSVGSDCRYGGGRVFKVYKDEVYFVTTLYNRSVLYKLDKDANLHSVYDEEGSVDAFDIANGTLVFVGMKPNKLQELYRYDLENKACTQCTHEHDAYLQRKDVRECVPCSIQQGDMTLYGWVLEPRNYDPSKHYPAILDIHGGPKTVYGEVYYHEMQVWANMGYFVFFMNPRGGDGRGNTFADIRGKYGTIDYDDLMKFTDVVLEKYPCIDANRVGVTGGSYGGFMTNWIITHTDRFKAAASQRSISNWISFANTSDIGEFFAKDQQAADPQIDHEKLWGHSPLKYAKNCVTPTLFIHSDEDYRCPLTEGIQMYMALRNHGVESRLCMFKKENHELSRSGQPRHRVKRLEEITMWMEKHLK